ncbi:ABC transporter permease subunit [Paenibacillus koleovorans]|uniref:ABC transporter permease subunit n=1 Tax=Paenibacillus koleovorans TaxID=121608 RepID=UPI001FE2D754|nr:ABC transporter permease subunit [Paenibacillus koleovorans]
MNWMWKIALGLVTAIVCSIVFAALPLLVQTGRDGLALNWSAPAHAIADYFRGWESGASFRFRTGKTEHLFFDQIWGYATVSLQYSALAALVGTTLGVLAGVRMAGVRKLWVKQSLELLALIPDFILILWLQLAVVVIYKQTGWRMAKVASLSVDDPAILLPLLTMTLIPALYIMRSVSVHTHQVLTEDYMLTAKAKGLPRLYAYLYHVVPNVLPFLKAELHKLTAIIVGNLFIMEYLFNLRGLTKLLLSSGFTTTNLTNGMFSGYQFNLTVNCFFVFMLLYMVLYGIMLSYIRVIEKRLRHE